MPRCLLLHLQTDRSKAKTTTVATTTERFEGIPAIEKIVDKFAKVAIVRGANSVLGIGRASAHRFAENGTRAVYLCDYDDANLATHKCEIESPYPAADIHVSNLYTSPPEWSIMTSNGIVMYMAGSMSGSLADLLMMSTTLEWMLVRPSSTNILPQACSISLIVSSETILYIHSSSPSNSALFVLHTSRGTLIENSSFLALLTFIFYDAEITSTNETDQLSTVITSGEYFNTIVTTSVRKNNSPAKSLHGIGTQHPKELS
ncbi:hypothetical protein F4820DRAFT_452271 [Hypoxylon rubiginosum]|uniref:Uncharacterized protein n=1 Tax=Hypoxylon rubiginosum TaxID=110542 RepID=A0ACB9YQ04_9PEZI|nr:hypothetical protein F4820DRAFT_452271 [Hypoxylon rubiginosum]